MKCIYCNLENDLTVSDIIPYALTGSKLSRKFVCEKHNRFTNDNYEKEWINKLSFFRNLIGFTTRDANKITYKADIEIDGYKLKKVDLTDRASFYEDKKRLFQGESDLGEKVLMGNIDKLSEIKTANSNNIKPVNIENVTAKVHFSLNELFTSDCALHSVAKIAYEAYCYYNEVELFDETKYQEIVSYILDPQAKNGPIEIVIDEKTYQVSNCFSRTGSNMLFEYDDIDGFKYIVFGFWNLIIYKIKICQCNKNPVSLNQTIKAYFFHADGEREQTVFAIYGIPKILSDSPNQALNIIYKDIVKRISRLGNCEFSYKALSVLVKELMELINWETNDYNFNRLLDYGSFKRVAGVFILEQLYLNKNVYDKSKTFNENLRLILGDEDTVKFTEQNIADILMRYKKQDEKGLFIEMLKNSIDFFKGIREEGYHI